MDKCQPINFHMLKANNKNKIVDQHQMGESHMQIGVSLYANALTRLPSAVDAYKTFCINI